MIDTSGSHGPTWDQEPRDISQVVDRRNLTFGGSLISWWPMKQFHFTKDFITNNKLPLPFYFIFLFDLTTHTLTS